MRITADFSKITGRIKPMHGIGQPPTNGYNSKMHHFLGDAGIPYSRLHDVGGWMGAGLYVDIPNLFRDFDADENNPDSYDFSFTDMLIKKICEQGTEPFFRLGVSIENAHNVKTYRIYPPKDPHKWARICEHVIRHYNEGWADGYHLGIKYWEIWNEPDSCFIKENSPMWKGTAEEFFELYEIAAKHLKSCFGDSIRVGGYGASGFWSMEKDPECNAMKDAEAETRRDYYIKFMGEFLKWIGSEEHKAPLDFFSWHSYSSAEETMEQAEYCRRLLDYYGFGEVEDILNEWNTEFNAIKRSTPEAACKAFSMMLGMQKQKTSILCFYDGRMGPGGYGGLFNPDTWRPYLTYYALMMFNHAYQLENEVFSESDSERVYTLGAANGGKAVLLIANNNDEDQIAELSLDGVDLTNARVTRIDNIYSYNQTGERIKDGRINLPARSCVEIAFD